MRAAHPMITALSLPFLALATEIPPAGFPPKPKNALLDGHQVPVKQQAKQAQSVRIPPFNYKKPPMEKPSSDALVSFEKFLP